MSPSRRIGKLGERAAGALPTAEWRNTSSQTHVVGRGNGTLDRGDPRIPAAVDDRGDEFVLVREVPVDRARREAGAFADEIDARALVPALAGDLGGSVEDPFRDASPFRGAGAGPPVDV